MQRNLVVTSCLLSASLVLMGVARSQAPDLLAFTPTTIAEVLRERPKTRDSAVELLGAARQARFEATLTGQQREPSAATLALLAGMSGRTDLAQHYQELPEIEVEDGGQRAWVWVIHQDVSNLSRIAGTRVVLYVNFVGFADGRPVMLVSTMATPEGAHEAEAMAARKAARKAAEDAAVEQKLASRVTTYYGNGQLRFTHRGKPYSMAAVSINDPNTGQRRLNASHSWIYPRTTEDAQSSFSINFGQTGADNAVLTAFAPGAGRHTWKDVHFYGGIFIGGVHINLDEHEFPGCSMVLDQLDTTAIQGRVDCPTWPGDITEMRFAVTP